MDDFLSGPDAYAVEEVSPISESVGRLQLCNSAAASLSRVRWCPEEEACQLLLVHHACSYITLACANLRSSAGATRRVPCVKRRVCEREERVREEGHPPTIEPLGNAWAG